MTTERDIGYHEAKIEALEREIEALRAEIKELRDVVTNLTHLLQQARGGYKVVIAVATIFGALGLTIGKIWSFIAEAGAPKT